ncbi:MAG: DUF932 domain-containing protein, partial [Synergistaceae bacterium]|nr:DUF932 domain-containing protein [Synergistaceae bacterium]
MKQGKPLAEVLSELQHQNKMKRDYVAPARAFRLEDNGETFTLSRNDGTQEMFNTTDLFHRQIGSTLEIPAKYYDQMRKLKPELLARNVNAWFGDREQNYMIRAMKQYEETEESDTQHINESVAGRTNTLSVARALLSDRYRRIDNTEIATAVLPLFAGQSDMEVISSAVTESRLFIKVVNRRLEQEVKPGDIVQAGVVISNSEVGLGAVSVQPLIYRLVCSNGLIAGDVGERRTHIGRTVDATDEKYNIYSDETREAEDKLLLMKLRDATKAALEEAKFAMLVDKLR